MCDRFGYLRTSASGPDLKPWQLVRHQHDGPIEGMSLVGRCEMFLLRGCEWSDDAGYSY
jgi:hypothetical protein